MGADHFYAQVGGDEAGDPLVDKQPPTRSEPRKRPLLVTVAIGAAIAALVIALLGAVFSAGATYHSTDATTNTANSTSLTPADAVSQTNITESAETSITKLKSMPITDCGGNAEEARNKGCVYDVMMQLWMRPECYDGPLSERYLVQGNWTWYADPHAEHAMTDEEIRRGEHSVVYVAQSYHRHHCIFAWEKLVRAMRTESPLIEELISYDHVMHCRHKTLTPPEEGGAHVRGVVAPTGYTRCASYDIWLTDLPYNKMSSSD